MSAAEEGVKQEQASKVDYSRVGVLAGMEWSSEDDPPAELTPEEITALKMLCQKATKRDYPARIVEIVQAWEAALFYRGFQFLVPREGGGWLIPGESTGYGPSMQMDLALLPTNIYGSYAQMIMSALTRDVPKVRFEPSDANDNKDVTAADEASKFLQIFRRNNPIKVQQNDGARYLWCDGRYIIWTRWELNGQKFGWHQNDVPETAPEDAVIDPKQQEQIENKEFSHGAEWESEGDLKAEEQDEAESTGETNEDSKIDEMEATENRTPRGQEIRSIHGKLETKICPMSANDLDQADVVQIEMEVDVARAKAMFYWKATDIKGGSNGMDEGEIARLARQNTKLGMQSAYVTSDSIAEDVTIQRNWIRPGYFMHVDNKGVRESLIKKFRDGALVVWAGETFCYARNEGVRDSLALVCAYSGDGQNRNALGTSFLPSQKRINNWLDLMNDYFVRGVPKIWHDNKAFDGDAIRNQTNIPGDRGLVKRPPNTNVDQLVWAEPQIQAPQALPDFVKQYIGPLGELLTGGYPALGGGNTGSNDTAKGIAEQRDQALGRLGPTWHFVSYGEAESSLQGVKWGAKCRNGSITESIPGGEIIKLEVGNLQANILCFPETDENFPESWAEKQQRFLGFIAESGKNPQLAEVMFNPANLKTMAASVGMQEFYLKQVKSLEKQQGEFEVLLKSGPIPNPMKKQAMENIQRMTAAGGNMQLMQDVIKQVQAMPDFNSTVPIDVEMDDHETEYFGCWMLLQGPRGRKLKMKSPKAFQNVRTHAMEHMKAQQEQTKNNPKQVPKVSANYKDIAANDPAAGAQIITAAGFLASPPASASPAPAQ